MVERERRVCQKRHPIRYCIDWSIDPKVRYEKGQWVATFSDIGERPAGLVYLKGEAFVGCVHPEKDGMYMVAPLGNSTTVPIHRHLTVGGDGEKKLCVSTLRELEVGRI